MRKPGTALAPSQDVVPGSDGFSSAEEQEDMTWYQETETVKLDTAGADFGAPLASPGPKADLVSPTTVGECANQEPPWCQVGVWYLVLVTSHL